MKLREQGRRCGVPFTSHHDVEVKSKNTVGGKGCVVWARQRDKRRGMSRERFS
jgi:hypothetical protein